MTGLLYRVSIWLGGLALLGAALVDTGAMLARNLMTSIHGSIEIIQLAVLIAGAIGLVVAVASSTYARVHLLTDRLSVSGKAWLDRFAAAAVGLFFICILAGSAWIAADLWSGQERSEVVGVPWRWMRLFANLCFLIGTLVLLRHCLRPRR
jgi:TRAP-type C4-dicarboxylate transport system permease small subunit